MPQVVQEVGSIHAADLFACFTRLVVSNRLFQPVADAGWTGIEQLLGMYDALTSSGGDKFIER